MEKNVVSVKIYGQEYNITGEKSREHIIKVADYVDRNMHDMAEVAQNAPVSALAILASINIADEYFETAARLETQENINLQKDKDIEHYIQLWEEAKKNFTQFREENATLVEQRDKLREAIREKEKEISQLKETALSAEKRAEERNEERYEILLKREKELESNFFDLQMENIRLKSELDRMKKNQEDDF
ncbi:MAG: cell division protein ZapA [Firmicutes bacterium]|nr:cell division protein ZapA [Bacillota bacterium]MBQ3123779.1 cell division protein ZapA [Bacillota bacterium]MBQ9972677.1 cell division protein ZapA [Bacillota bacterium]